MADRVPAVRVTIGEDFIQVAQNSTYNLSSNARSVSDVDLVTVTEPAALAYDGAGRSVVLPEGRFISLDVDAGRVVGVTASPHLQALPLRNAVVLAHDIGALLEAHGWTLDRQSGTAYAVVEQGALADTTDFFRADMGRWQAGGDDVVLRLKQVRSAAEGVDGRRYLLNVEFENTQLLHDHARARDLLRDHSPAL